MSDPAPRKRLAAILAADAAGYSRLMGEDERGTLAALEHARAIFRAQVEAHQGRVIDMAGDSVLAAFETAAGAVAAALGAQHEVNAAAQAVPQAKRMLFRIGVHLGDVIEKADGTIYGDGVNIAARLQAVADPGGVMVSAIVHDTVRDEALGPFEDAGTHEVKNIARPLRAFRIRGPADPAARRRPGQLRWVAAPVAAFVLAAIATWIATADATASYRQALLAVFRAKPAESQRTTIAVLPFANQSGDPKKDYFSDGITEDIIHALGRFSGVMVSSRSAVLGYKAQAATPMQIGRELGVRYIAQGSVREADGKLRVTVELSDAGKGTQLWSERYEGSGAEVFEIQDRIVRNIVGALAVKLTRIEQERVFRKPTESLEAYDLVLRARSRLELNERAANREARALLGRAHALAPEYAEIPVVQGEAEFQRAVYGWVEDAVESMKRAEEFGKRALSLPDERAHARAHALMSAIYGHQERYDEGLHHSKRAIELNASDATALQRHGTTLLHHGRIDDAIATLETARRFDAHGVVLSLNLAVAYYLAGRYRDAIARADVGLARAPHHVTLNAIRAASLAELGETEEARKAAERVRRYSPVFEAENFGTRFTDKERTAKLQAGLRKAGL